MEYLINPLRFRGVPAKTLSQIAEKEANATYVEEKLNVFKSATITNASVTDNVTQSKKKGK